MAIDGSLEYATTRVHARHALLLDESTWHRIESSRGAAHFLGALRTSTLAEWIAATDDASDSHRVERMLRGRWVSYVNAVAAWHPLCWQRWLQWLAWLPGLSLFAHLARGAAAPAWLMADPVYSPLAARPADERPAALAGSALAPLSPVLTQSVPVSIAWNAHWQRLLPHTDETTRQHLRTLQSALTRHAEAMRQSTDSGAAARVELARSLAKLFRQAAGTVVATVCHLGLLALQLERLRGGLVRRMLFATTARRLP